MTSASNRRAVFLNEMDLGPQWVSIREAPAAPESAEQTSIPQATMAATSTLPSAWSTEPAELVSAADAASAPEIRDMGWPQLRSTVAACTKCGLCKGRTKTVFGVGDVKAKWLFIGEGPGRNEDLQGEPFVGPAGKLLDSMLSAMGLKRGENAYITNIVKCRPTDADGRDRPPTQEEANACKPYLERQIALIQPSIIVALGKTAALSLLGLEQDVAVAKLRGTVHRYANLPLIVTYHPAYLLRKLTDKGKTWSDLCLAMDTYANSDNTQ